jgi:hypothetical protein
MLTPDHLHTFLRALHTGRGMRLITVLAVFDLVRGTPIIRATHGDAVVSYLKKHWRGIAHCAPDESGSQAWRAAPEAVEARLGLSREVLLRLRRVFHQFQRGGFDSSHIAALLYGLAEHGVTRSQLHQWPWTARGKRVDRRQFLYMQDLVERGLVLESRRPHRGGKPEESTVWHTTAKGRALVLGEWMNATAPLRVVQPYQNRNAA